MQPIQFILLGGFLGAGKTTAIARLAAAYQQQGKRVGIVTNDQATDLVDTHSLRAQGYSVGEVAGACFCCNFNELTATITRLEQDQRPDIVLAEPVGSCTDLVATVIQPILGMFGERFDVAPYGVILKPAHGLKILREERRAGFSPKAAYIFRKQLEEADFVIINRIDQLAAEEIEELSDRIDAAYPGTPVLRVSAKTGENFDALLAMLEQRGAFGRRILDLDYDIYAEGEAELGWLNSSLRIQSDRSFVLDDLLLDIVARLRERLDEADAETAHLKTIGLWEGASGVANLVSRDSAAELSLPSDCQTRFADLVVNARVAVDPETLEQLVNASVDAACAAVGARIQSRQVQSFRPGRPEPTHRYAEPA
jgi:G3E family GTPase